MNDKVFIFDTTLRDGEQSPGAAMTFEEKINIAVALDKMGVDVIEAGFAASSQKDFDNIKAISAAVKSSIVCSLSRATFKDIEASAKAIKNAERGRIHTFISTSPIHMRDKLKKSPEEVLEIIKSSVSYARNLRDDIEWSAEDATRTDPDFLCKCVEIAINSGATTINLPDTVGYTTPDEYYSFIKRIKNNVPNIDKAIISAHCHNDLGMATANSLAAVNAGARQIECSINGLGERAGNASLEEIVMAIKVRGDKYPYQTGIDATHLTNLSKMVSSASGFAVQKNKAIVGENAFAHASGIHQDGIIKNGNTYSIMSPSDVGCKDIKIVLTRHSGMAALKTRFEQLKIDISEAKMPQIYDEFKKLSETKKIISNEDLLILNKQMNAKDKIGEYKIRNKKTVSFSPIISLGRYVS